MRSMTDSATVHIDASPGRVWELLTDVTRMSAWSPTVERCEWTQGNVVEAGARFRGYNKQGRAKWSRECRITVAEPAREFSFTTYGGEREETRWRYTIEARDAGTLLAESFEVVGMPIYVRVANMLMGERLAAQRRSGMEQTLARIKAAAEAG